MYKFTRKYFPIFFILTFLVSFEGFGQSQTEEISDKNIKFLSYKPSNYDSKDSHPLIIFLHGMGERGSDLNYVKRNGPPRLIDQGKWPSDRPFIVISPQLPSSYGNWPPTLIDDLLEYVKTKYKVDNTRIYVTGLSLGGNGAWMYANTYPQKVAAAVPICGWGAPHRACEMKDVPTWAFHGDADGTVNISGSINMVNGINACTPGPKVRAKLTTYPGVGHDSWTRTYDLSAGHDIYAWMLQYTAGGQTSKPNEAPSVFAGNDQTITLPLNKVTITGIASDNDGSIASYNWTKTSGPNASLQDADKAQLLVSNMIEGEYIFKLTVKDNEGTAASDEVKVIVKAAPAPVNIAPTVFAGNDQSITLPENKVMLTSTASDSDGSIASFSWTKTSGPNASLQDAEKAQLSVSDMSEGEYIFKLTVKDNEGATSSDEVKVTVEAAPVPVNKAPTVFAGNDQSITLPENKVTLIGTASDSDGSIASYSWAKTNGPEASLQDTDKSQLLVSAMSEGEYIFKLTVNDNSGAATSDEVKVTVEAAPVPVNQAPTVFAGNDQSITLPENKVTIGGSASDSDGSIASYSWTKTSGPEATLQGTDKAQLLVSAMSEGEYIFKLTVKDNDGAAASDEVKITVNSASNQAPTVFAGNDRSITLPENKVTLIGTASDSDGSIASYSWTKISGPVASLQDTDKAQLLVSAMSEGEYVFKLTVKDNSGASASDDIKVTVEAAPVPVNKAPTVFAGNDQSITLPENKVIITGSASDSDGSIASYSWTKINGPEATLQDIDKSELLVSAMSEGEYTFKLTVKDNSGAAASDDVKVTVNAASNQSPLVILGDDIVISLPQNSITLKSNTSDADGFITSYSWTKVSGPAVDLPETNNADLSLTNLVSGFYTFKLTVVDNDGATASDDVKVRVNNAPTANAGYDKTLTLPNNKVFLSGAGSDTDGTIISYEWHKISGGKASIKDEKTHLLSLSDLEQGEYEFELKVVDNNNASATDKVKVFVNPADNIKPVVDAGEDIIIRLPENSVMLSGIASDEDGQVVNYKWTQTSGDKLDLGSANSSDLFLLNLSSGIYEFELSVTDNQGAIAVDRVKVTVEDQETVLPIVLEIKKQDLTCFGESNGSVEAIVSGGKAPYSYLWSNGSDLSFITNLSSGEYSLTVTDALGEIKNATVAISSPEEIKIEAVVSDEMGKKFGSISINVSGGTAPYQTKWFVNNVDSPDVQGYNISELQANSYAVQVTDANGCTKTETFTVSRKGSNSISVYPNPSEGLFKVSIDATGGAYTLSIIDSKGKIIYKEAGEQEQSGITQIEEFDLRAEGRGIYFVRVQYELGAFSIERVIIK